MRLIENMHLAVYNKQKKQFPFLVEKIHLNKKKKIFMINSRLFFFLLLLLLL